MAKVWERVLGALRPQTPAAGHGGETPEAAARGASGGAPSAGNGGTGPVSLQHVWTAEPNAVKLQVSRMILPLGEQRRYPNAESTQESPLAQALFEMTGVTAVNLDAVSVEVFLEEEADWDALMEKIPAVIKAHLESGLAAVEGLEPQKKKFSFGFKQIGESDRTPQQQMEIVQNLLDSEINPAVASHGGYFTLVAVEDNNVYVQLGGGCQGCGMVDVTLRQGVEQRMKQVLPEMKELIDVTDHHAGTNPYFQPGK